VQLRPGDQRGVVARAQNVSTGIGHGFVEHDAAGCALLVRPRPLDCLHQSHAGLSLMCDELCGASVNSARPAIHPP
jgi:hypothetical protein